MINKNKKIEIFNTNLNINADNKNNSKISENNSLEVNVSERENKSIIKTNPKQKEWELGLNVNNQHKRGITNEERTQHLIKNGEEINDAPKEHKLSCANRDEDIDSRVGEIGYQNEITKIARRAEKENNAKKGEVKAVETVRELAKLYLAREIDYTEIDRKLTNEASKGGKTADYYEIMFYKEIARLKEEKEHNEIPVKLIGGKCRTIDMRKPEDLKVFKTALDGGGVQYEDYIKLIKELPDYFRNELFVVPQPEPARNGYCKPVRIDDYMKKLGVDPDRYGPEERQQLFTNYCLSLVMNNKIDAVESKRIQSLLNKLSNGEGCRIANDNMPESSLKDYKQKIELKQLLKGIDDRIRQKLPPIDIISEYKKISGKLEGVKATLYIHSLLREVGGEFQSGHVGMDEAYRKLSEWYELVKKEDEIQNRNKIGLTYHGRKTVIDIYDYKYRAIFCDALKEGGVKYEDYIKYLKANPSFGINMEGVVLKPDQNGDGLCKVIDKEDCARALGKNLKNMSNTEKNKLFLDFCIKKMEEEKDGFEEWSIGFEEWLRLRKVMKNLGCNVEAFLKKNKKDVTRGIYGEANLGRACKERDTLIHFLEKGYIDYQEFNKLLQTDKSIKKEIEKRNLILIRRGALCALVDQNKGLDPWIIGWLDTEDVRRVKDITIEVPDLNHYKQSANNLAKEQMDDRKIHIILNNTRGKNEWRKPSHAGCVERANRYLNTMKGLLIMSPKANVRIVGEGYGNPLAARLANSLTYCKIPFHDGGKKKVVIDKIHLNKIEKNSKEIDELTKEIKLIKKERVNSIEIPYRRGTTEEILTNYVVSEIKKKDEMMGLKKDYKFFTPQIDDKCSWRELEAEIERKRKYEEPKRERAERKMTVENGSARKATGEENAHQSRLPERSESKQINNKSIRDTSHRRGKVVMCFK